MAGGKVKWGPVTKLKKIELPVKNNNKHPR